MQIKEVNIVFKNLVNVVQIFLVVTCVCTFFISPASAEKLVLKDGKEVEGKVLEETDEYIKLEILEMPMTYYFEDIESIDGEVLLLEEEIEYEEVFEENYEDKSDKIEFKSTEEVYGMGDPDFKISGPDDVLPNMKEHYKSTAEFKKDLKKSIKDTYGTEMSPFVSDGQLNMMKNMMNQAHQIKKQVDARQRRIEEEIRMMEEGY